MLAMQAQSSGLLMHTATAVAQPPITTIKSSSRGMTTTVVSSVKKNKGTFFSPLNLDSDVIEHIEGGPRNKQLNHHGLQSLTLDIRLSKGIGQVNRGNYAEAISIFDMLLEENPKSCDALLGRGTAYAFLRNLEFAITDFSKAIEVDPTVGEAWKRRGQARAAIGATTKALEDLTKAMELEPGSADLLHERGIVYYKLKDFGAAVNDLQGCVVLDPKNKFAYNYLGLSLTSSGNYAEGIVAHRKAVELDTSYKEGWTHLAQSYKELADSDKAIECLQKAVALDGKYVQAYRLWGILLHGLGDHKNSVDMLSKGLEVDLTNLECLYMRASCYHALGEFSDAIKDYDLVLRMDINSAENRTLQDLSFYQREIALYTASKLASPFNRFDIDEDLDPLFKEAWCKRLPPNPSFKHQPSLNVMPKGGQLRQQDSALTRTKKMLLEAADEIGRLIQYNCPGFLRNIRQHRMAGLAALEIAQKVLYTWQAMHENPQELEDCKDSSPKSLRRSKRKSSNGRSGNRGGPQCSNKVGHPSNCRCQEDDDSMKGPIVSTWRDVFSIAVKWRQVSEPCDSVVWVDMLSEKEFKAGFGSHTPMVLGQAKVVRYHPNAERALQIVKDLIKVRHSVNDAANKVIDLSDPNKLVAVDATKSCFDLYKVVGKTFWVNTECMSTAKEGKILDGTRLTLQKTPAKGLEFSIRTPGTPDRWAEYDIEMTSAWEAVCDAYCNGAFGSMDVEELEPVRNSILRLCFYWYNFMPLARGTAVVGYITLLGLFLAANMKITANIPENFQVDWEAILSPHLNMFTGAVQPWLYPSVSMEMSWQSLPDVSATFGTTGAVISALSSYDM
ncbi:hypothetical protein CY35_15G025500 [Sphagnum magellanicum]|nr:hypothetical protein CY35_15G025500 [Sphagnum magellanicum]KAH9538803.1 hypothetical protein CY35_15G025500 [Sphagnum magellanicum]